MPTEISFPNINRGDTVPYTFNFAEGATPIDMRGRTFVMTFKLAAYLGDDEATLTKTIELAADDADAAVGIVSFVLEHSETSELIPGVTYFVGIRQIREGSPEDIETTFFYGTITVEDV